MAGPRGYPETVRRLPSSPGLVLLSCCVVTLACTGRLSSPRADGCEFAADPSSCWREVAASILDCMEGQSQATLSTDAKSCSFFNGPYAKFDAPVPAGTDPDVVGVTIGYRSTQCARIERNRSAGTLKVTGPDGRTVREEFDADSATSSITCPSGTVHLITSVEVMDSCFSDAMSGGVPSVLVTRDANGLTVALSGYDPPLIVCR